MLLGSPTHCLCTGLLILNPVHCFCTLTFRTSEDLAAVYYVYRDISTVQCVHCSHTCKTILNTTQLRFSMENAMDAQKQHILALKQRWSNTTPCTSHPSMHNCPTGWVTPTFNVDIALGEQFQFKPLTPTRFSVSQLFGLMWWSSIGCLVTPIPYMSQKPPRYIGDIYLSHIFVTTYIGDIYLPDTFLLFKSGGD